MFLKEKEVMPMSYENCKNFEGCDAPLCPMDENSLKHCIWYPNEDICKLRKFQTLDWVKKQKLIAKKHGSVDGFFSINMLQAIKKVSKGISGANPDNGMSAEQQWFRDRGLSKSSGKSAINKSESNGT